MPRRKEVSLDELLDRIALDFHRNRNSVATFNGILIDADSSYPIEIAARALGINRADIGADVLHTNSRMYVEHSGQISGYEIQRRKALSELPKNYLVPKGMADYFHTDIGNINQLVGKGFLEEKEGVIGLLTRDSFDRLFEKVFPRKGTDMYARLLRKTIQKTEAMPKIVELETFDDIGEDDDGIPEKLDTDEVTQRLLARTNPRKAMIGINVEADYLDKIDTKALPIMRPGNGNGSFELEYRSIVSYKPWEKGLFPGKDFTLIPAPRREDSDSMHIRAYQVIRNSSDVYVNAEDMKMFLWGQVYMKQGVNISRLTRRSRDKENIRDHIRQMLELAGMPAIAYKGVEYGPPGTEAILALDEAQVERVGGVARRIAGFDDNGFFVPRNKLLALVRGIDATSIDPHLRGVPYISDNGRQRYSAFGAAKSLANFMTITG